MSSTPSPPPGSTSPNAAASSEHAGPAIDREVPIERIELGNGAWVDVARGWLRDSDELYATMTESVAFRQASLWRYE